MELPTFDDVRGAADRLAGHARRTPVLIQTRLDDEVSAEIYLKCENFQRIGAFKFRGAWNAISQLDPEARNRGVVTHSSGNHGQAVALTGQLLGIQTTVVMPQDAPGTLSAEQTADVVAYLLSGNRLPAGDAALPGDVERLSQIPFEP